MCGIAGKIYFNDKKAVQPKEIQRMTDAISHRGPDDAGAFTEKNVGLGHRRLSIIDLSPLGHQPMSDDRGKIWIVFNGEIYNFLELRHSLEKDGIKFKSKTDTEIIIYLYKKYGVQCLQYLRGMFAFAIWDKEKQELFLARDRAGKKPLKYYFDKNTFIFASELKAILKNAEVKKEVDFGAIDEYLTYQYVPHPKTGFKNIYKLEPAHYLIVKNNGEVIKEKYWNLDYSQKLDLSEKEWEVKITDKLKESVKLRMISDVPLGAHLSGGIDSSLIVALMAQEMKEPVKTFSIGFKEADYNELHYAKMVANRYKTDHREFIVEPNAIEILPQLAYHYEEPFADPAALPTWYLSQLTRQHVTVALNGDGGDENFAGYSRYNAMKLFKVISFLPFKKKIGLLNGAFYKLTKEKIFKKGFNFLRSYDKDRVDFYFQLINYFNQPEKELIYSENFSSKTRDSQWYLFLKQRFDASKNLNWLNQLLYVDFNSYLPGALLPKVDIASMAHALEIRSPFLDYEFLELTAKMPVNLKLHGQNKKYLLKQIAYKYLPKECIDRPKRGFSVPLEYWFKNQLNNYLKSQLLNEKFYRWGFKKEGIEQLITSHESKHNNYANRLWALLMLNEWFKQYF